MNKTFGKTFFSWNVPAINGGSPEAVVNFCKDNNFEGIMLKCASNTYVHKPNPGSPWPNWGNNIRPELIEALRAASIDVHFWQSVSGYDSDGELRIALQQIALFEPDTYTWDAESAFDSKTNAVSNATTLALGMRTARPNLPQAICWWALPISPSGVQWHPLDVVKEFLKYVDFGMPMMYWQGSTPSAAVNYFNRSIGIWRTFTQKPIIPAGRAYVGDGGSANPTSIEAFANVVMSGIENLNINGITWWSADNVISSPENVAALRSTPKFSDAVILPDEEILHRLILAHPELFPELS